MNQLDESEFLLKENLSRLIMIEKLRLILRETAGGEILVDRDSSLVEAVFLKLLDEARKKKPDYKEIYRRWHSSRKAKRDRAQRNKIRRYYTRKGLVKKGDGKEIDHIVPMSKGGSSNTNNLRVVSRSENRRKGSKMPKRKKK